VPCCFIKIKLANENVKLEDRGLRPLYIDMDRGLPGKSQFPGGTGCKHIT